MNSQRLARWAIYQLESMGISELILCAGARNAPLVCAAEESNSLAIKSFYNESSAAFYALGRAKLGLKVAVLSTSGTAVAQFLPACIEAFYDQRFLCFVTADRPKKYRNTGAPQTISQQNILKDFCGLALDLEEELKETCFFSPELPLHLNLCFEEPLWWKTEKGISLSFDQHLVPQKSHIEKGAEDLALQYLSSLGPRDLLVISRLSREDAGELEKVLPYLPSYIYMEASSQLSKKETQLANVIRSGESFCGKLLQDKKVDRVLHLGGVPCLKLWRELDSKYAEVPVVSISRSPYSGLLGAEKIQVSSFQFLSRGDFLDQQATEWEQDPVDRKNWQRKQELWRELPRSELSLVAKIAEQVLDSDSLFVGNSMPIREWDMIDFPKVAAFHCNRGANGIDGLLSSFLGSQVGGRNILLLGDLSCLYDLSWGWAYSFSPAKCSIVFVINNQGGRIFERVFPSELMINSHQEEFRAIAEQYSLNYQSWEQIQDLPKEGHWLIELKPSNESSQIFWQAMSTL